MESVNNSNKSYLFQSSGCDQSLVDKVEKQYLKMSEGLLNTLKSIQCKYQNKIAKLVILN